MDQALTALGDDAPPSAEELYQIGFDAMTTALELESEGMLDEAEESAIIAMALFEDTTTIMAKSGFGEAFGTASEQGLEDGQGLGVGGIPPGQMKKLNVATIFTVSENINDSEEETEGLKSLILNNNLNVDLSDYENAINLAKTALANGEIPDAQEKLEIANGLLEKIYKDMNDQASILDDDKVQSFVDKTIKEIESLLESGNKIGLTQNTINELRITLEILRSGDTELILQITSEEGNLAKGLKEDNKIAEEEQKSENKDEEKATREENKDAEKELREQDPEAAQQLKVDNKITEKEQKSENKNEEKILREENKDAEKEQRDLLKLIRTIEYFSYDDDWFEEPTESDYNDVTTTPTDKELKKQFKAIEKAEKKAAKAAEKAAKEKNKENKSKGNGNGNGNGNDKDKKPKKEK